MHGLQDARKCVPQSLEQKSSFIKLRWGSLQDLAQYDQTSAFMFYPKFPPFEASQ